MERQKNPPTNRVLNWKGGGTQYTFNGLFIKGVARVEEENSTTVGGEERKMKDSGRPIHGPGIWGEGETRDGMPSIFSRGKKVKAVDPILNRS